MNIGRNLFKQSCWGARILYTGKIRRLESKSELCSRSEKLPVEQSASQFLNSQNSGIPFDRYWGWKRSSAAPHPLLRLLPPRNLFRANHSPRSEPAESALLFFSPLGWSDTINQYFSSFKTQGLSCSFCRVFLFVFLFSLALPSAFINTRIIIFNFLLNKMPQVLIHASPVSPSRVSPLNMDHCLTLHPFSLDGLLFWHDLIHLIGLEIMTTVWFMSKPRLQGKLLAS